MRNLAAALFATFVAVTAACSGDDGGIQNIDAGIDSNVTPGACSVPAGTISSYPGSFQGTTVGANNDLTVAEGACTNEIAYDGAAGLDTSIELTGLTAGTTYIVNLSATTDLSLYVATMCDAAGPTAGNCLAHTDETTGDESLTFVATGTSAFVIVDAGVEGREGPFTVDVSAAECTPDNTAACTGATPYCVDFQCVACRSSFDCPTAGAPECVEGTCGVQNSTCVPSPTQPDSGENDNGPAAAQTLSSTPINASVCSAPLSETDWYKFEIPAGQAGAGALVALTWQDMAKDLDILVTDAQGFVIGQSYWGNRREEVRMTYLPTGTYYVVVTLFTSGMPEAPSVPYSISVTTTAPQQCATSTDCATESLKQVYRGACNTTAGSANRGACEFIPAGTRAEGMPCDSGNDCGNGLCSYRRYESDAEKSVCTKTCTASTECSAGFACTTAFTTIPNMCWPSCLEDIECGVSGLGRTPANPADPWEYLGCTPATGACGAPM